MKNRYSGFTPGHGSSTPFKAWRGFTLLELIIVIVILGILAALGITNYQNAIEKARGDVCINNMKVIFAAWRIYNMREATDYNPGTFRNISQINTNLGTVIDERYFGGTGVDYGNYGFYMNYITAPRYSLSTYRQGGIYNNTRIQCHYYPNGNANGIYYDWETPSALTWPWILNDE